MAAQLFEPPTDTEVKKADLDVPLDCTRHRRRWRLSSRLLHHRRWSILSPRQAGVTQVVGFA